MNVETPGNDQELLAKVALGDQHAFEALYRHYSPRIYKRTLHLLRNEALAEEVLQDVFIKIWEKRASLDSDKSFQSLLYKIATNLVTDLFRKAAVDRKMLEVFLQDATDSYDPSVSSPTEEVKLQLDTLLSALPPQRRKVFELVKIEQKSYEEVAALLGISKSTVSDHIVKAMKTLKDKHNLNDAFQIALIAMFIASL